MHRRAAILRVAAFPEGLRRWVNGDAVAIAHLGVLRAAYTLATGYEDMATPMPTDLDVSKILVVSPDKNGTFKMNKTRYSNLVLFNLHGRLQPQSKYERAALLCPDGLG